MPAINDSHRCHTSEISTMSNPRCSWWSLYNCGVDQRVPVMNVIFFSSIREKCLIGIDSQKIFLMLRFMFTIAPIDKWHMMITMMAVTNAPASTPNSKKREPTHYCQTQTLRRVYWWHPPIITDESHESKNLSKNEKHVSRNGDRIWKEVSRMIFMCGEVRWGVIRLLGPD